MIALYIEIDGSKLLNWPLIFLYRVFYVYDVVVTSFPLVSRTAIKSSFVSAVTNPSTSKANFVIGCYYEFPWIQLAPSSNFKFPPVCKVTSLDNILPPK